MARSQRSRPWRPQRSIRLVDAENVAGTGRPTRRELADGHGRLDAIAPAGPHDHTIVAAGEANAVEAGLTWPTAQLLVGHGPDGADVALLEWATTADLAQRFDALLIASGDFAFVSLAAEARAAGLPVTVVAWRNSCSRVLAGLASRVLWLDRTTPTPVTTALEAPRAA